jgi:alkylation response protein AidB-like acyl-CoA dehydrogenase
VRERPLSYAGAGSIHKRRELERLYRDVRAGAFHPPNSDAVRDLVERSVLGLLQVGRWTDPAFRGVG